MDNFVSIDGFLGLLTYFFGEQAAYTITAVVVIFAVACIYIVKTRILPAQVYTDDTPGAEAERSEYVKWRDQLVDGGGIPKQYDSLLNGALNALSRFLNDVDHPNTLANF